MEAGSNGTNLEPEPFGSEDEYKDFVEHYLYLANGELANAEMLQTQGNHRDLIFLLPRLISIVNVLGYLRGQDNRFTDLRPSVDFQSALYKSEDEFECRLGALIQFVQSTDSAGSLSHSVSEYYLKNRAL